MQELGNTELMFVTYLDLKESDDVFCTCCKALAICSFVKTVMRQTCHVTVMYKNMSPVVRKNRAGPNSVKTEISFDMFCLALAN